MRYRIKNTKTGQLGWMDYATKREAAASAREHSKVHGVRCVVVNANGQPLATRAKIEDGLSRMVRTWNANAGRRV